MTAQWMKVLGLVGAAAIAAISLPACTAETSDGAFAGESEADLTAHQLPGVAAVEIASLRNFDTVVSAKTVGAPKKVKTLVAAAKKLKASEPVPKCMSPDATRLTYLDAAGAKLATLTTFCGSYANLSFEDGRAGYSVRLDTETVGATEKAPFAVGDALWGISKIELARPERAIVLTDESLKPVLAGFDLDAVPDPDARLPRCVAEYALTFKRADKGVAYSSFLCGDGNTETSSVIATFSAVDPTGADLAHGAIQIDPRAAVRAFSTSN